MIGGNKISPDHELLPPYTSIENLLDFRRAYKFHITHCLVFSVEVGRQLKRAEHHRLAESLDVTRIML